jgi:hypothetical protein
MIYDRSDINDDDKNYNYKEIEIDNSVDSTLVD